MYSTLISAEQLLALLASGRGHMVFDCTSDLMNPPLGRQRYRETHIAQAVYADLNTDLSHHSGSGAASGGRHPLPSRERFAAWLGRTGMDNTMQAVVYDRNATNYCVRLWWMLKWAGHDAVAVLDGGLQAWQDAGGPLACGEEAARPPTQFALGTPLRQLVSTEEVMDGLQRHTLVDARATPRYKGEFEPLDPVAGHIPGALNRPFQTNLGPEGRFKSTTQLRAEYEQLLAGRDPASVVHHCGSGVSALPNLLAMELAGLGQSALYAGSWSEWCADPARPVAKG
jgi:thiosulfate/3-mercaptopyruvate sulfurtransferase